MNKLGITPLLMMILLLTLTLLVPIPQINASPLEISAFKEEITTPTTPLSIGVNSTGTIYYGDDYGNLWASVNNGASWTCIFNSINASEHGILYIFVDSNDDVWFVPRTAQDVYKYNGTTTMVLENCGRAWHWDEHSNGSIYFNPYGDGRDYCYRTNDQGNTWIRCFDASDLGYTIDHIHSIKVNPDNGNIYVATGDGAGKSFVFRYTDSWNVVWEENPCDFWFKDNYVYIGHDSAHTVKRIPYEGTSADFEHVIYNNEWRVDRNPAFVQWGETIGDIMVFTAKFGHLWASWDGEHWVMLYKGDTTICDLPERKTPDGALLFPDAGIGKILKFYVDKTVLYHLFYQEYTSASGGTVTYEHIVRNGTNYIDLGEHGVVNANITLIGQAQDNIVSNGTFEYADGDGKTFAGWKAIDKRYVNIHPDTTYYVHGEKSMRVYNSFIHQGAIPPEFAGEWSGNTPTAIWQPTQSSFYILSFYVHANVTNANGIKVRFHRKNATFNDYIARKLAINSSKWLYHAVFFAVPDWVAHIRMYVTGEVANSLVYYDDFQIEYYPSTVYEVGGLNRQYIRTHPWTFTETQIETNNPQVKVGASTYSHSGELANGTESQTWSLDVTAGIIKLQSTVYGSGQVKVKLEGTKVLSLSGAFIRNKIADDLYNGTYYGTVTIATDENYIILLSDSKTTMTSATLTTDKLTFTLAGYSGYTSTTKVYCGSKGEPRTVTGATSWSYNSTTKICTLTATHPSGKTVTLEWGMPPIPEFPLGGVAETSLVIAILYVWLKERKEKRRHKTF